MFTLKNCRIDLNEICMHYYIHAPKCILRNFDFNQVVFVLHYNSWKVIEKKKKPTENFLYLYDVGFLICRQIQIKINE